MTITVEAIYEDGVLKPKQPLPLDGRRLRSDYHSGGRIDRRPVGRRDRHRRQWTHRWRRAPRQVHLRKTWAVIFVDRWAWVALADRRDAYHRAAAAAPRQLVAAGQQYSTTDYVLSETVTHLYGALRAAHAQAFVEAILRAANAGKYRLVHVTPDQFQRAWQMRVKYHDKPGISFVDFTSMICMQDLAIAAVFTGDEHFRQGISAFNSFPDVRRPATLPARTEWQAGPKRCIQAAGGPVVRE